MSLSERRGNKHHVSHPDEKWLVSYSDMMTLLFGFFVLLYSLAAENPQEASRKLAEISNSMGKPVEDTYVPPTREEFQKTKEEIEALKIGLATEGQNKEKMRVEFESLKLTQGSAQFNQFDFEQLKKDLAAKQIEIDRLTAELSIFQIEKNDNSKVKNLEDTKMALLLSKSEIEKMQKIIDDLKANNFILVIVKWTTDKHDIDLTVKSPKGSLFSFKNRTFPGEPGELILDSRFGPGVEIWSSNKFIKGKYDVNVVLYNQYGNTVDTPVQITLVSSIGKVQIPQRNLNLAGKSKLSFSFDLNEDGKIQIIGI
jgi:flagellar motor protein MotB